MTALPPTSKARQPAEYLPVQGFLDKPLDFGLLLGEIRMVLDGEGPHPA